MLHELESHAPADLDNLETGRQHRIFVPAIHGGHFHHL